MSNLNEDKPPEQFFLNFGVGPKVVGPKFELRIDVWTSWVPFNSSDRVVFV